METVFEAFLVVVAGFGVLVTVLVLVSVLVFVSVLVLVSVFVLVSVLVSVTVLEHSLSQRAASWLPLASWGRVRAAAIALMAAIAANWKTRMNLEVS